MFTLTKIYNNIINILKFIPINGSLYTDRQHTKKQHHRNNFHFKGRKFIYLLILDNITSQNYLNNKKKVDL